MCVDDFGLCVRVSCSWVTDGWHVVVCFGCASQAEEDRRAAEQAAAKKEEKRRRKVGRGGVFFVPVMVCDGGCRGFGSDAWCVIRGA